MKITPPTKIKIALPNLDANRVCFYGYDVGMDWLVVYATKHMRWDSIDLPYDDFSKASAAMGLLRIHSGIKHLGIESAIKDHTAPSDTVTVPGRPGVVRVPIVSIFTDEGPSYNRRPSQEQVDRLSQILGKQPRWWVDYNDPRSYYE
jgi:hypothetical protein